MLEVVSWQPTLSDHQVHVMRAFSTLPGVSLKIVVGKKSLSERDSQGWKSSPWDDLEPIYLNKKNWWVQGVEILESSKGAIHLFGGLWGDRRYFPLICYAAYTHKKVGLITEPYSDIRYGYYENITLLKGTLLCKIRPLLYRIAGYFLGSKMKVIFTISTKAEKQFNSAGFLKEIIFPFGYFVPRLGEPVVSVSKGSSSLKMVFVGNLIDRKGADIAITLCNKARILGLNVQLDVYGPGNSRRFQTGTLDGVRFCGVIPFGETQRVLSSYDLLIVPSRFDGWGVVVNEGILQGIPVFVSKEAGASELVKYSDSGFVFNPYDISVLLGELENIINNPLKLQIMRDNAFRYSQKIEPMCTAKYLYNCLTFVEGSLSRPSPDWAN